MDVQGNLRGKECDKKHLGVIRQGPPHRWFDNLNLLEVIGLLLGGHVDGHCDKGFSCSEGG